MFGTESRKRAHSPDAESGGNFKGGYGRGPPGGHYGGPHQGYGQKRHRAEDYHQQTLDERIARLGDVGFNNMEIGLLAKDIDNDLMNKVNEDDKINAIVSKICKSIVSFPTRVGSYATLIGLLSVKHYNVSCQIINSLHASYPVYLESQKWREALTIIHLLSSLVNCKVIRPQALLSQFEHLLEIAGEGNTPQARGDYFVYTVLSSLPYVAADLAAQQENENFDQLLRLIEDHLDRRSKTHIAVTRVWLMGGSTIQMDYLDSLWVQMKNFKANNWTETFVPRPYNDKEYKDIMASSLIPQNSPTLQIPAHQDSYIYPAPKIVFRLFEDDVGDLQGSIPGSDKIERFCIENYIRDIIDEIHNDPRVCVRHLSHMHNSATLPMKHLLIETILGELFAVPRTKHRRVLYHTLLYEMTKIFQPSKQPNEMKFNYDSILFEAIKILYDKLGSMNVTCVSRFIEWLSFHLNNTDFLFPWKNWADATLKDKSSPTALFVYELLNRCVRLSFHKKIKTLVSPSLDSLMPAEVGKVVFQPLNGDHPNASALADTIQELIMSKAEMPKFCEALNIQMEGVELPEGFTITDEKLTDKLLKVDIFLAKILNMASQSLTHMSSAIGKYRFVIKSLISFDGGQVQLLRTMHSCLEAHPQLQVILVDKLLKADLVDAKEVCNWLFSDSMKEHYFRWHPFEILNNTLDRSAAIIAKSVREKSSRIANERAEREKREKEAAAKAQGGSGTPEPEEEKDDEDIPENTDTGDVEMKQEDELNLLDERIRNARNAHNNLILHVFQLFANALSQYLQQRELGRDCYLDNWFRWVTGRMQEVYYSHYDTIIPMYDELTTIVNRTQFIVDSIMNLNR